MPEHSTAMFDNVAPVNISKTLVLHNTFSPFNPNPDPNCWNYTSEQLVLHWHQICLICFVDHFPWLSVSIERMATDY